MLTVLNLAFGGLSLKISEDYFQAGNTLGGILYLAVGLACIFSANASVNRAIAPADAQRAAAASASAGGTVNAGSSGSDELIHVYRGTDRYAEIAAYEQTGHLMSDATRNIYFETGNLETAYMQSGGIHDSWLKIWGE